MFVTISNNLTHFTKILIIILLLIITLTIILYNFTDDNDFANLPPKDKSKIIDDRFISLFYYNSSTPGGLGDAKIYPISNLGKLYTSIYLIIVIAGFFTVLDL